MLHSLWQAVALVRRTLLVAISVEADPLTRGLAFSVVNALFLGVHIFAMPCTHWLPAACLPACCSVAVRACALAADCLF